MSSQDGTSNDRNVNSKSPRSTDHIKNSVTQAQIEDDHPDILKLEAQNLVYTDDEHEPQLHWRTWLAVFALCTESFANQFAILGPPTVLSLIAQDLDGVAYQAWVPNAPVLVQAALCVVVSSASDLFQARKSLLVFCVVLAFIGAAIAPGSKSIGRLIAAQTLIGGGNVAAVLGFAIPSEILPNRWRPMAQAAVNGTGALGMIAGPLIIGALTKNKVSDWRLFWWIEAAFWGTSALCIFFGYLPPTRHTRFDHLSFWQKLGKIDLLGALLLAIGLVLLLAGLNIGGGQYPWVSAPTLSLLVIGIVSLVGFGLYEWKGTRTGILHHDLFNHDRIAVRTFVICLILIFVEGVMLFTFIIFYPILTEVLFERDLVLVSARVVIFYATCTVGTVIWSYMAQKLRGIREALLGGYFFYLVGTIGFATIQPGHNINIMVFAGVTGFGVGAILTQIIVGVQLASPHAFLATATAVAISTRAIAAACFTAIYSAVVNQLVSQKLPKFVAEAASAAGLADGQISTFVQAITANSTALVDNVPGVSESIVYAGVAAREHAYADSIRYTFVIAAPFVLVATVLCWWLGDLKKVMTYHVDAPVEVLKAKVPQEKTSMSA